MKNSLRPTSAVRCERTCRSRGGLSTKIHTTVDALGNPLRWILTGGEVADVTQAPALIEGFDAQTVIADRATTPMRSSP